MLKPEYLNTLDFGTHTLSIFYNDGGVANCIFTIKASSDPSSNNYSHSSKHLVLNIGIN